MTWTLIVGIFLIPTLLYAMFPFLPVMTGQKVWVSPGLVVAAEETLLASVLVLGQETIRRYCCLMNPRDWFRKKPR